MNEEQFWKIISLFDWDKKGDDRAVMKPAEEALASMTVDDIKMFEEHLAAKLYALDTEAHALGARLDPEDDYLSVDYFLYQRCCVVANGKDLYHEALADPTQMPQDLDFESILYLAGHAHKAKTGLELDHSTKVSYETYSNTEGWR